MFVGFFTSVADERAKKKNQQDVLKLMIQNEALKERKVKDYQIIRTHTIHQKFHLKINQERSDEETPQNKNKKQSLIYKVCLILMCEVLTKS